MKSTEKQTDSPFSGNNMTAARLEQDAQAPTTKPHCLLKKKEFPSNCDYLIEMTKPQHIYTQVCSPISCQFLFVSYHFYTYLLF